MQLWIVLVRFCSGLYVAIEGGDPLVYKSFLEIACCRLTFGKEYTFGLFWLGFVFGLCSLWIILVRFCPGVSQWRGVAHWCMNNFRKECRFTFVLLRS